MSFRHLAGSSQREPEGGTMTTYTAVSTFLLNDFVTEFEGPEPGTPVTDLFRDEEWRLDRSMFWDNGVIEFAVSRVEGKELSELGEFVDLVGAEPLLTAQFFLELSTQERIQAPYGK